MRQTVEGYVLLITCSICLLLAITAMTLVGIVQQQVLASKLESQSVNLRVQSLLFIRHLAKNIAVQHCLDKGCLLKEDNVVYRYRLQQKSQKQCVNIADVNQEYILFDLNLNVRQHQLNQQWRATLLKPTYISCHQPALFFSKLPIVLSVAALS